MFSEDTHNLDLNDISGEDAIFDINSLDIEDFSEQTPVDNQFGNIDELSLDNSLDFDIDAGADIFVDFESKDEEISLDASILLSSQVDISRELIPYSSMVSDVYKRVKKIISNKEVILSKPNFNDFSFISNKNIQQQVYAYFCSVLDDLVTDKNYSNLDKDSAYDEMKRLMYDEIHFTPNIYDDEIKKIFSVYYEKNRKLSTATVMKNSDTLATLVDIDLLELSDIVYRINSEPWKIITDYFTDINNINQNFYIDTTDYAEFVGELKAKKGSNRLTSKDVFNGIIDFLTSDDMMTTLSLTVDKRLEFTLGEFLRRYVALEMNDGTFYPSNISDIFGVNDVDNMIRILYIVLSKAVKKRSIAAEILCLTLELMYNRRDDKVIVNEFLVPFVISIARYLYSFTINPSSINPTFYYNISKGEEKNYLLNYVIDEKSYEITSDDILCLIIGDRQDLFRLPTVLEEQEKTLMICPPPDIVSNLRSVKSASKIPVNGNLLFRYTPTFYWLSNLNFTTGSIQEEEVEFDTSLGQDNNPLLSVLFNYDNNFDKSGDLPELFNLVTNRYNIVLMKELLSDNYLVLQIIEDGKNINARNALAVKDDEGGFVIRYFEAGSIDEQIILLESNEFELNSENELQLDVEDVANRENVIPRVYGEEYDNVVSHLRNINKELCDRESLDYEQELVEVKKVIARDLFYYLGLYNINNLLARSVLIKYEELANNDDYEIGSFYKDSLKDLLGIVVGDSLNIPDNSKLDRDTIKGLITKVKENLPENVMNYFPQLEEVDLHILALQACSKSEVTNDIPMDIYEAVHGIQYVNYYLRSLEEQMILLRTLIYIGDNIASIVSRNKVFNSLYNNLCTLSTVSGIENNLKSSFKDKSFEGSILSVTKRILDENLVDNYTVIKYFVLTRNLYGVLSELEECFSLDNFRYDEVYSNIMSELNLSDIESINDIDELEFNKTYSDKFSLIFNKYQTEFRDMIYDGLIKEISSFVDIKVVEMYDTLSRYGKNLFTAFNYNNSVGFVEDLNDTRDYDNQLNSYLGSFCITYSPVIGEAPNDIDGGFDRYSAYLQHRQDFCAPVNLVEFERFGLKDLTAVMSTMDIDLLDASLGLTDK